MAEREAAKEARLIQLEKELTLAKEREETLKAEAAKREAVMKGEAEKEAKRIQLEKELLGAKVKEIENKSAAVALSSKSKIVSISPFNP